MKQNPPVSAGAVAALLLICTACTTSVVEDRVEQTVARSTSTPIYPATTTGSIVDDYHGTVVADPYRWLEDDVRENPAVESWVQQQNAVTNRYLDSLPGREAINSRMTQLWNYERSSTPRLHGSRYWYSYNNGLSNQSQIFATSDPAEQGELILDPNTWSEDGTVALAGYWPSPDGTHVAYTVADGGTDWRIARVTHLATGATTEDELRWLKFTGLSWNKTGTGFYYNRYPEPAAGQKFQSTNLNKAVYFHRLGDPQSADQLILDNPAHPERGFYTEVTDDGNYLVITSSIGTDDRYEIFVLAIGDAQDADAAPRQLVRGFDYDYTLIGNIGSRMLFRSNNDAPRGKVIEFDLAEPSPEATTVVPETANNLLSASLVSGTLVLHYLQDAASMVVLHDLADGNSRPLALPGIGSVSGFPNNHKSSETFFSYASINQPATIFTLDVDSGASKAIRSPKLSFDPDDYLVTQEFFASADGTKIPMFIASKKTTLRNNAPTLLYGYGGFNVSLTPGYSVTRLAWMELGGVFVQANLRGGGEYGSAWHKAGTKLQKQNVFDDFIAAAQHLIDRGVTTPAKLGVHGRSNGGLLVGAVVNQRPDLFGAAIPGVGVMDMLRFHRFTAGRFWTDDYGSADNADEFAALYKYSPYHNIKDNTAYPPVLVTTADTDDRVVPGHSFKYAAALQAANTGEAVKLLRVETRSGHGAGKPTSKRIAEFVDMWAFLAHHLGLDVDS